MDEAWRSPGARPSVVLGGLAPAAIARSAAPVSEGWVARYFSLGPQADAVADAYLEHYYGPDYFAPALRSAVTVPDA